VKQPNQPWPNAPEAIEEARAALVAAGLDIAAAVDSPSALAGPTVTVRVPVGDGHFIVSMTRAGHVREPRWTSGLAAWRPHFDTRGITRAEAKAAPTAVDAMACTLVQSLGQIWPTEAEREAMHGMLARLRAAEADAALVELMLRQGAREVWNVIKAEEAAPARVSL
jgi:hypothetical protein